MKQPSRKGAPQNAQKKVRRSSWSTQAGLPGAASRWPYAILLLLPWLLWLINRNLPFQGAGHMDPWYYLGHFLHFPLIQNAAPTYAGERMAWILPGMLAVRILGAAGGVLFLHSTVAGVSLCAFYSILKRLADARTAFLTAVLLGTHPLFLGANGWDYVDGASLMWQLLALAFLAKARASERPLPLLFLSATAWWGLIYNYLAWAILTPGYLFLLLAWTPQIKPFSRRVSMLAAMVACGFVAATACMMAAYYGLGAKGQFFAHSLAMLRRGAPEGWLPLSSFARAFWLVFPAIAAVCAAVFLCGWAVKLIDVTPPQAHVFVYHLYGCVALTLATIPTGMLAYDYFADILLAGTFLTLGVTLFHVPESIGAPLYYGVLALAVGICAAPLTRPMLYLILRRTEWAAAMLLSLLATACWRRLRPAARTAWALVTLTMSAISFPLTPSRPVIAWMASRYDGWSLTTRVSEAVARIAHRAPGYPLIFWFDNYTDPLTTEYRSIWCAMKGSASGMTRFPALSAEARLVPGAHLVILDRDNHHIDDALRRLSDAGVVFSNAGQDAMGAGAESYWIRYVDIQSPRPSGATPQAGLGVARQSR